MKRIGVVSACLFLLWLPSAVGVSAASPVRALRQQRKAMPAWKPGEVIVKFATGSSLSTAEHAVREGGGLRARRSAYGEHFLVTLEPGVSVSEALMRFQGMREVEYAEPNGLWRAAKTPNDEFFEFQWNMLQIGAPRTWDIQTGKATVAVAVLDTGIAYEDFGPYRKAPDWGSTVFLPGFDFVNGDDHANEDEWHGTHVASTIAEATDNGEGVAGLAFHCALMPVKVLDFQGFGSFFDVAEGIDFAVNFTEGGTRPVKVINMSLGGSSSSESVRRAVDRALAAGVTVVAAAGNDGVGTIDFPAAFPAVIAVGALDFRKQLTPYTNFGPELDFVAPGGDSSRDDNNDGDFDMILQQTIWPPSAFEGRFDDFVYLYAEGTSQATPHVAAAAALLYTQGITDPAAVRAALEQTAEDLGSPGRDDRFGHGLIRPAEALSGLGLGK